MFFFNQFFSHIGTGEKPGLISTPTPLEGYSSGTTNLRILRWREKYLNSKEAKWMTASQGYIGYGQDFQTLCGIG